MEKSLKQYMITEVSILGPASVAECSLGKSEMALAERISSLETVAPPVFLAPESRYDNPSKLSGLCFLSKGKAARVYPGLVNDVGCGYHLIRVRGASMEADQWNNLAGAILAKCGVYSLYRKGVVEKLSLGAICAGGLKELRKTVDFEGYLEGITGEDCFAGIPSGEAELSDTAQKYAKVSFGCPLGHFLEIRTVDDILSESLPSGQFEKGDYIIIIHSGSQGLHRLLQNELHAVCHENSWLYNGPISDKLGQERLRNVLCAENYSRASRFLAAVLIKAAFDVFHGKDNIEYKFISDVYHSQVLAGEDGVLHARGIQLCNSPFNLFAGFGQYFLLAGTENTSSFLFERGPAMLSMDASFEDTFIGHGTPERYYNKPEIGNDYPYSPWKPYYADKPQDHGEYDERVFEWFTNEIVSFHSGRNSIIPAARLKPALNLQKGDMLF
ncbi:MAG: RtcB family protein [Bacillota bacterium]|nr:RtcB family protein [Bacillota bacterium]